MLGNFWPPWPPPRKENVKTLLELFGTRNGNGMNGSGVNQVSHADSREFPRTLREKIRESLNRTLVCVPCFAQASPEILARTIESLRSTFFSPREFLFEYEGPAGLYMLVSGAVELRSHQSPAQAVTVSGECFFAEDALFGFSALLSARAMSDCDAYFLSRAGFESIQAEFPLFVSQVDAVKARRVKPRPERTKDRLDPTALKIFGFELAPVDGGVGLQWNHAPAAHGYRVLRKLGGGAWEVLTHTEDPQYEDKSGSRAARYRVQAYSDSALGESSPAIVA